MGPKTEEEMAIELFNSFNRLVSAVERIADALTKAGGTIGPEGNLTVAKEMQEQIQAEANTVYRPQPSDNLHP